MSTGSFGTNDDEDEERIVREATGWGDEVLQQQKSRVNNDIVNIINSKVSLKDIFEFYNITFEEKYSPSGWTHYRNCPFPHHNDSSPSFYYNPKDNFFNCFGCKKKGNSVSFIAAYKQMTVYEAAEHIIDITSGINLETIETDTKKKCVDEINMLLLYFSNTVNLFIQNNKSKEAIEFIEKLTWSLDVYLHAHVQTASINATHLKSRIKILLRKISSYGR